MIKGTVEKVTQNKANFFAVKVNGEWYGTGKKTPPPCVEGDLVEFNYTLKDGKWKNVDGSIRKAEGSAPAPAARRPAGGAGREDYWTEKGKADAAKEPRIAFQGAYERAVEVFKIVDAKGGYPSLEKLKAADKLAAIRALIEAEADHIMQLAWNAEVPKGKAAPAAEPTAEAEMAAEEEGWN